MGGTGEWPEVTETRLQATGDGLFAMLLRAIPSGGPPAGAGKLPAPPIFQTRCDQGRLAKPLLTGPEL